MIHRDFAIYMIDTYLFNSLTDKSKYLTREDFFEMMKKANNIFIKPNEIRK
jgi:hypothetical protein